MLDYLHREQVKLDHCAHVADYYARLNRRVAGLGNVMVGGTPQWTRDIADRCFYYAFACRYGIRENSPYH